jgi:hypothetical protein
MSWFALRSSIKGEKAAAGQVTPPGGGWDMERNGDRSMSPALLLTRPAPARKEMPRRNFQSELYQPGPGLIAVVQAVAGTAVPPLETAGVIVVFVIFILLSVIA